MRFARTAAIGSAVAVAGVIGLGLVGAVCVGDQPIPPKYTLYDVGSLGGDDSRALGMNQSGTVVGWSTTAEDHTGASHAFIWQDGEIRELATPGHGAEARDVNESGQIVGVYTTVEGERHGIYWFDDAPYDLNHVLHIPSEDDFRGAAIAGTSRCYAPLRMVIEANAINEWGEIIACGLVQGSDEVHGILLTPLRPFFEAEPFFFAEDLGRLPAATECVAYNLNEWRESVGVSGGDAFIVRDGLIEPLDDLTLASEARAVNNYGVAVGWIGENDMVPVACRWEGERRFPLGAPPDWISVANDVSDAGLVVGWTAMDIGHPAMAVAWEGCIPNYLNTITQIPPGSVSFPFDTLEEATAIDNLGRIAGFGRADDGRTRAFLLVPRDILP